MPNHCECGIPTRSSALHLQLRLCTADVSALMKGRRLTHHHLVLVKALIIILLKKALIHAYEC